MIGMEIQLRNRLRRSQRHRQLQLCIPLVITDGDSYRMKQARAKGGTKINKH